jgi:N-methylhydantoinase A
MAFVGVDVGGTFTDVVVAVEPDHQVHSMKTLTTSPPEEGVMRAVRESIRRAGLTAGDVHRIVNATTLATNAVLEGTGARTAFVTTSGFGDMFELGMHRPTDGARFDLGYERPAPLVPVNLVVEVIERLNAQGEVLVRLDEADTREKLLRLAKMAPESVAVCLLHSYANPVHERRLVELVAEVLPDAYLALSSSIWPEFQEYERASTTVVSAYVGPIIARYVRSLGQSLRGMAIEPDLQIMQSSGVVLPAEAAAERAVYSVESGPAAGVMMAADLGRRCGWPQLVSFDMGGTTAKACLIQNGELPITHDFRVGGGLSGGGRHTGEPIKVPVIDLTEVGAGGGSIAWVDDGGLLHVGPRSAGADPGPACYDRGGRLPTVTDANIVLGYLNPEFFLGGQMRIDPSRSREAVREHVAEPLALDLIAAARGIYDVANLHMASAIRAITIQRGVDPRQLAIVAFGGAGPTHVVRVADQFGIPIIVVPPSPGVASALGLLGTDIAYDHVSTRIIPVQSAGPSDVGAIFETLERTDELRHAGVGEANIDLQRSVDVRFVHQRHELSIPFPGGGVEAATIKGVEEAFRDRYAALFGVRPDDPCVFVNFRVRATGRVPKPRPVQGLSSDSDPSRALKGTRDVYFRESEGFIETPVYDRTSLCPGDTLRGPAVLEEPDSTTTCPPGYQLRVDGHLNLVLTREGALGAAC